MAWVFLSFFLVSFTAELKTKEIGTRKMLGASTGHVIVLLSKEFMNRLFYLKNATFLEFLCLY